MVLDTLVGRAIIGKEVAKQQGISDPAQQLRLGLIGGLIGSPILGIVATSAIARQQAQQSDSGDDQPSPDKPPTVVQVKVPDITQYDSVEEAKAALTKIELKLKVTGVYSNDDPENKIVGQVPEAGDFVAKGSTVEAKVVQKGAPQTQLGKMPLVKGMSLDAAKAAIASAGQVDRDNISVVFGLSCAGAQPNEVMMQNPDPNSEIGPDSQPTLMIAGVTTVPNLKGKTVGQAALALVSARLVPEVVQANQVSGSDLATVVAQAPDPGEQVAIFSTVRLQVKQPEPAQKG